MRASTTPDTDRNRPAARRLPADPAVLAAVGERLARARRHNGLTLANVAERSGVSPAHVSQIESGTANPTLRTLLVITEAVGTEPVGLFDNATSAAARRSEPGFAPGHARAARGAQGVPVAVWDRTADGARLLSARLLQGTVADHAVPSTHAGEEYLVVLRGTCRLHVGALGWDLAPGDSCHFDAGEPHHLTDDSPDLLLSVVLSGSR